MKILIVIADWKPVQNPNVIRWAAIAEYWAQNNLELSVLSTKHFGRNQEEVINGVDIYRTGYATLKDLLFGLLGKENKRSIPQQIDKGKFKLNFQRSSKGSSILERLVDLCWRKFYWPDGSNLFIRPAIKKGTELLEKKKFDIIISVGLPFSCHLVARHLKKKHPGIHWHMDIEDPFCYSKEFWVNNFDIYEKKNIEEERKTFQLANSISVTNENAREKYGQYFPDFLDKIKVIPPLLGSDIDSSPLEKQNDTVQFGYFGSFYKNVRSPERLLNYLQFIFDTDYNWLKNKCFHFYGAQNQESLDIFNSFKDLNRHIVVHGLVDYKESIRQMHSMDFLINFGNTTSYHLPSKSVDYLCAQLPIINFKACQEDSFESFAGNYEYLLNLDIEISNEEMDGLINDFITNDWTNISFNSEEFRVDSIAESYIKLIS